MGLADVGEADVGTLDLIQDQGTILAVDHSRDGSFLRHGNCTLRVWVSRRCDVKCLGLLVDQQDRSGFALEQIRR